MSHDYFTDIGKFYIEKTIQIFKHFIFSDFDSIMIEAEVFGDEMKDFNYFLYPVKNGIEVQLTKKKNDVAYMFGIVITKDTHYVYHNAHGPFFDLYGFKYERSP